MAKLNWDRTNKENRARENDWKYARGRGGSPMPRRNQFDGPCPKCGKTVSAGKGWLKGRRGRRPYHQSCLYGPDDPGAAAGRHPLSSTKTSESPEARATATLLAAVPPERLKRAKTPTSQKGKKKGKKKKKGKGRKRK
jgi:hypothetical protein